MTLKIYSVKSNARRDARKLGLDPLSVVAEGGGYIIGALRVAQDAQLGGKQAALRDLLAAGWKTLPELAAALAWQPHTVRGVISRIGKSPGLVVERKREAGVPSYRVVRS
jgi:hypothetical protein